MADFPSFDLFSEIEDLSRFVDGKNGNKFDFISLDEHNMNAGLPSFGILDNDAMLADDSSNALLGDPLLNYFDQKELLELQSASPSHNPETFMPVSLPADSPPPPSAVEAASSTPPTKHHSPGVAPVLERTCLHTTRRHITVNATESKAAAPVGDKSACVPVRIIVKTTKTSSSGNMVAPITLQKPTHSLVKIPITEVLPGRTRLQAIRSGGKLGPLVSSTSSSRTSTVSRTSSTSSSTVSRTSSTSSTISEASSLTQQQAAETTSKLSNEVDLFRSLRARQVSGSSDDAESLRCESIKRKAYQLGPQQDPMKERCRQNAINAKRNREVKKAHMVELERKVESISRERDELAGENESLREAKVKLEQQVKHLNNVLRNQSKLSSLIEKLGPSSVVLGDVTTIACEEEIVSSGMCLHVDGEEATVEYCSFCAKKAGKKLCF